MKKSILIFSIFMMGSFLFRVNAQTAVIDSLENRLRTHAGQDTARVNLLNEMADCLLRVDHDKSLEYAEQARGLAETLGYEQGEANSLHCIGMNHHYQSDYTRSLGYYLNALAINEEIQNKPGISKCLNSIGMMYLELGNYPKAFEYYEKALKLKEALGDKSGIAMTLTNIGIVHSSMGNYSDAIEYFEKAMKTQEELDNQFDIARSLNEIGTVHSSMGNYSKAIEYYNKSLKIQEGLGNKFDVADILINIGEANLKLGRIEQALENIEKAWDISSETGAKSDMARSIFFLGNLYMTQGNYQQALQQFEKTRQLHQELGEKGLIARDYVKIGETYHELGNNDAAISNALKGLSIAEETERKEEIKQASRILAKCFAEKRNFEMAYRFHLLYKQTTDSLFSIESQRKINALESRYELEGKEKEIALHKSQLSLQDAVIRQQQTRQKTLLAGLIAIMIIVLLAGAAYLRIRQANKKITELDKFKQGMIGMIVHDLKNPLNAILTFAEKPELINAGRQMLNMVLNILDVQKFEDTRMTLKTRNHALSDISERAVEQVRFLSQRKNVVIRNSISPEITVRTDTEITERIFVNLLTNGIKYSPNNGEIHLSANPENYDKSSRFVRIEVTDMGKGIPADKIGHVFDKFNRIGERSSGPIRSTGLGLAFCKLAVRAHGGTIGVNSIVGKGTEFWFTLPKAKYAAGSAAGKTPMSAKTQPFSLTKKDKNYLAPFIKKLKKYEVYEVSALVKILKQIDSSRSRGLKAWKEDLQIAIDTGNNNRFEEVLKNSM
ncbi:tetratricopeptide repeat-containing sensor histidine kinase [bacterium]|nr:tetratricopeptide repeat-containing sensor histidine kinase [bacterium]